MATTEGTISVNRGPANRLTAIAVRGYKSVSRRAEIQCRPLTVLAGANSSGKSSFLQPLLLMKQTLDSPFDPGGLRLNGPNVRLSEAEQALTRSSAGKPGRTFDISFTTDTQDQVEVRYKSVPGTGLRQSRLISRDGDGRTTTISPGLSGQQIQKRLREELPKLRGLFGSEGRAEWRVVRTRCGFDFATAAKGPASRVVVSGPLHGVTDFIRRTIHAPALRGNPSRVYRKTAVGEWFPGTFETYTASVVHGWERNKDPRLETLRQQLSDLRLANSVGARLRSDTEVELRVGRTLKGSATDMVNVADVGFGCSQVLPTLVALLVAEPKQCVLIEQPELHLHPRAQKDLARVLCAAAKRGVSVTIETHSSILLRGLQTLVAEGAFPGQDVSLNWFERNEASGYTQVTSSILLEDGALGDWPADFDNTFFDADRAYLDAASKRRRKRGARG